MADLVERESALHALVQLWHGASDQGRIALVAGEAGIGKTSLLQALRNSVAGTVWWGACDALQTPHPLGAVLDIARDASPASPAFARFIDSARPSLFDAVLGELRAALTPILVVIEDAHWADEATLDLLKFLGRRIAGTHALLAISYRDDELSAGHPLRRLIGELPPALLTRVELAPLSREGVETLARRALRATATTTLHATTQGNPFFVTEMLRHGTPELPRTVQDLVLARFARLDRDAQALVRLAALVPTRIERALLASLLDPPLAALEACLDAGLLRADGTAALSFRHELARRAIETSLPLPVAQALHAQLLQALEAGGEAVPLARLAHHAALADDAAAVRRYAPAAAEQAWARGAAREAVRHYRAALAHAGPAGAVDPAEYRRWLDGFAEACQRIDAADEAIAARLQLQAGLEQAGDVIALAANLGRLAVLYIYMARKAEADAASRRAIDLLEALPAAGLGLALANAYGTEAAMRMLDRDCEASVAWSRKAIALAREAGDRQRLCSSLSTLGTALMFVDYAAGCEQMEEALAMAQAEPPMPAAAATALMNLGSASGELMRYAEATRWLRQAASYAEAHELDGARYYSNAWLALCTLHQGHWTEAAELAADLVAHPGVSAISRMMALLALGRLRLRRGDPGVDGALGEALVLAGASDTLQRIAPVRAARAEAAFARGDLTACASEAQAALPLALRHRHACFIGELAYWCWRAGALTQAPPDCAEPFAAQIEGRWQDAASAWQQLGCPYEQARALADGDEPAQRDALALFEQLGAAPAAEALRRRLREAGVRGLARGARPANRERAFGLTGRELQVLQLLCEGLRNAEIARSLSRSVRTVDHHLAAIFAKLGVDSRAAAVQLAAQSGLSKNGQSPSPN